MYILPMCVYIVICMVIDSRKAAVGGRDEGDEALERDAELGEESSEV